MKNYPSILQSFGIVGILILSFIIFSPVYFISSKVIRYEISWLIYYVLAVGVTFFVVSIIKKRTAGYNSFNIAIKDKRILPVVIIGSIFIYCGIVSPITLIIPISASTKESILNFSSSPGLFMIFQSVIAAPILEELIFSGIILDGLIRKYPATKSILLTSFLFGLVHLNPSQFVVGFIMGVFTGWIYFKTRSISLSIIIHTTYNCASLLMRHLFIHYSLTDSPLIDMYGGRTNLGIAVVGASIIITICIYVLTMAFRKEDANLAKSEIPNLD